MPSGATGAMRDTRTVLPSRIQSIDLVRGLIMALMVLDHTRDFFFGLTPSPTDLETTTPALFATRWITHFCAPGFLLLAGASAFLQRDSRGPTRLAMLLVTRGLFLVALELTVVTFAWIPDPGRNLILLQVIWAIGWSMILLGPLVLLPSAIVASVGILVMVFHQTISLWLAAIGVPSWLLVILFDANQTLQSGGTDYIISYPILPWFGVMAAGYSLGTAVHTRPADWPKLVFRIGYGLTIAFVVLRAIGTGLDPSTWQVIDDPIRTLISFLNCEKYPPSPLFLMMTIGPLLVVLALYERRGAGWATSYLTDIGRAPLFFYVLHLYLLRSVGLIAAAMVWGGENLGPPPLHSAPEWPLWATWLIWLVALTALYPPTRWFAYLRRRGRGLWSAYL